MNGQNTNLIANPHYATRRADSDKCTWNESFDACLLCRVSERDLINLDPWSDGANDSVYAVQDTSKPTVICDVGDVDLDATRLEFLDKWLAA